MQTTSARGIAITGRATTPQPTTPTHVIPDSPNTLTFNHPSTPTETTMPTKVVIAMILTRRLRLCGRRPRGGIPSISSSGVSLSSNLAPQWTHFPVTMTIQLTPPQSRSQRGHLRPNFSATRLLNQKRATKDQRSHIAAHARLILAIILAPPLPEIDASSKAISEIEPHPTANNKGTKYRRPPISW